MSKLDELKKSEARLEAMAASGNTVAGGLATQLLTIIGAVAEVAEKGGASVDIGPLDNRLAAVENAIGAIASRLQAIEDALRAASPAPSPVPADIQASAAAPV